MQKTNNLRMLMPLPALLAVLGFILSIATMPALAAGQDQQGVVEKEDDLARYQKLTAELLEKVSEQTGIEIQHPVAVEVVNKEGVKEYMLKLIDLEYPGDELQRLSDSLAMFGLLPKNFDTRTQLVDLIAEQAGAFYDPRTQTFYAISDLPPMMKNPLIERTITAHELCHALQDQAIDLKAKMEDTRDNSDASYALQCLMEGQASVVMMTALSGGRGDKLPDLGAMMRMQMSAAANMPEMRVFNASPQYLRETLISPYAEGADFVQAYLRQYPEAEIVDMFQRLPASGEQILHIEKYVENDRPTVLPVEQVVGPILAGWKLHYNNTLGEFDIRVMASLHEELKATADAIADGWDGIDYAVFTYGEQRLLIGSSVWDSPEDAEEFATALGTVLSGIHGADNSYVERIGVRVSFVAGDTAGVPIDKVFLALGSAPAQEM